MTAQERHVFIVEVEKLIRQEILAILREAERLESSRAKVTSAELIEFVTQRVEQGKIFARQIPEF
jgi:hypothetical protein